jgi:hypothetical protein
MNPPLGWTTMIILPQSRTKYITKSHKVIEYHNTTFVHLRENPLCAFVVKEKVFKTISS